MQLLVLASFILKAKIKVLEFTSSLCGIQKSRTSTVSPFWNPPQGIIQFTTLSIYSKFSKLIRSCLLSNTGQKTSISNMICSPKLPTYHLQFTKQHTSHKTCITMFLCLVSSQFISEKILIQRTHTSCRLIIIKVQQVLHSFKFFLPSIY